MEPNQSEQQQSCRYRRRHSSPRAQPNRATKCLPYPFHQRLGILVEMNLAQLEGLAARERFQGFRQLTLVWQVCPID
jgi:hypothetical protein